MMEQGASSSESESEKPLKALNKSRYRKNKGDPEPRCNCKKHAVSLAVTLAIVSLVLIIAVIVLAVLLFTRSLDARAIFAVPSPCPPFLPSPGPPFVPCCPEGWVGYRGKCYYFSKEEKNWDSSQHFCSSFNASLAVIDTQQEKDFMMNYAGLVEHWIGLRRESSQPWKWVNGTIFNQQLFKVRAEGDCAYLSDVFVSSSRCYSLRNWICSKPDAYTKGKEHAMERD